MSRRKIVALVSGAALLALCILAVALVVGVTQTGTGQDYIRHVVTDIAKPNLNGKLYVGRISGGFLDGVTIDSVELRGPDDSLVAASGRIRVWYDVRDLVDKRVLLKRVEVEHPVVRFEQYENGDWNYKLAFRSRPPGPKTPGRGFGDYIVAESVTVHDASFILVQPWHPSDSLRGARLDSAITFDLARKDAEIRRRGKDEFTHTWRWTHGDIAVSRASFAEPDSVAKVIVVDRVSAHEHEPPFEWRNVRGVVRIQGDSLWATVPHFDLAGSTGNGRAHVWWGSDKPTRYDVHVVGDSVSLADVAWVYPTLPTTGGGKLVLRILSDTANPSIINYAVSKMDVHTTKSHVIGDMTFVVGGPVLGVRDVSLAAQPVNFDLLRTFAGKPFPYDFQGTLTGTVRARGGPVNRFTIDDVRLAYDDAHVPGAQSRFSGRGMVDILQPDSTVFRGFDLNVERLDLRTPRALNKNFPPLLGTVDGRARLDSLWLDVRVSDADLWHRDGDLPPSHFTGGGRVTIGDKFLTYDLALNAAPLSLTAMAHSYPAMPARGLVSGPMTIQGTVDDLKVVTSLEGAAGKLTYDGFVDSYEPSYGMRGRGTATALDLRTLFGAADAPAGSVLAKLPTTSLNFAFDADARGSGPEDLAGALRVDLDRSHVGNVRIYNGGTARVAFGDGRMRVDSLDLESTLGRLVGRGGLGLVASVSDSLRFTATVDSLGALRRWLLPDSTVAADSLAGTLRLAGALAGTIDTSAASRGLVLDATLRGDNLVRRTASAGHVDGELRVTDALRAPAPTLALGIDSLGVGRLALRRAEATFVTDSVVRRGPTIGPRLVAPRSARADATRVAPVAASAPLATMGHFTVRATSDSGPALALAGRTTVSPDTTHVVVDSARLAVATNHAYRLAAPANVTTVKTNALLALDPFVLRDEIGAEMSVAGLLQDTGSVSGRLAMAGVSLGDIARLGGLIGGRGETNVSGRLYATTTLAGTSAAPVIDARALVSRMEAAGVSVDSLVTRTHYATRRLAADVSLFRGGASLLTADASLPLDLALTPVEKRQLADTLRGALRTDSLDLALLGAMIPSVQNVNGRVHATASLHGTWTHPLLDGALQLNGGAASVLPAGVRLQDVAADLALAGDTLRINRLFLRSGGAPDTAALTGSVRFAPLSDAKLDLRLAAHNFLAVDRPRFATLWLSTPTPIRLTGSYLGATVRGAVRAERGRIYIPELIEKRIVDLSEYRDVVDTSALATRSLLPGAPSAFVENLAAEDVSVGVGDDVWLRSPEANIKLGGSLAVTRARAPSTGGGARTQLALRGNLAVERGTYRLSLPPIAQPIFEVQPGTLRFFGTPDLNPTLDIRAIHTVRQTRNGATNRPDVRVQVTIGGTLNSPSLSIASPDDPSLATTDLISYLVTGEPAAVLLGQQQGGGGAEQAVALGLRLVGSYASGALSGGGPFDVVQVETVSSSDPTKTDVLSSGRSILERTRLGVGGQLGEKTFYTVSAGLCGLGLGGPQSDVSFDLFRRGLGFKIERRLSSTLSLQFGFEPGSASQACRASFVQSVLQTPAQGGFDFLRAWSF